MYKYRCKKCEFEEWAPAFVVDEIAYMDDILEEDSECEDTGMPILVCPRCNADFFYTGEFERR
jgi:hypothetical protein